MGYDRFCVVVILAVTICKGIICNNVQSRQSSLVKVDVDSSRIVFQVDPAIYSFGLGCNLHFQKYNFSSPVLKRLAKELSPAYVRLGGTYCDFLIFHGHDDELQIEYKNKTLKGELWDRLNDFVEDVGFHLVFDVNVFLRTPGDKWDPSNFQKLLDYNSKRGYKVNFQLGNEPNNFLHKFNKTITPGELADDFKKLRAILKQTEFYQHSLLIGPDTTDLVKPSNTHAKDYLREFLDSIGDAVDVITTHFYYKTITDDHPTTMVDFFTDPSILDQFLTNTVAFKDLAKSSHLPNKPKLWYGESGLFPSMQMPNISDRFVSGMTWIDKLGICALNDVRVIVRQTLLGTGHRCLITPEYDPHPDYWSAVLYKRLVGTESLKIKTFADGDGIDRVRLYAHCTKTDRSKYGYSPGDVTVFGVNFNQHKSVLLSFDATRVDQFLLTPARTHNITSQYVALNGDELSADEGVLPAMLPRRVTSEPVFPAGSIAFFVLRDADFEICKR